MSDNNGFLPGVVLGAILVGLFSSKKENNMTVEYMPPAKPQAPQLPSLPPQMTTMLPSAYVTPINMDDGFFKRIFEKKRTRDISDMVGYQKQASDNMLAIAKNNAEAMKIHMTFAAEVQMVFIRFEHEKTMFSYEEKSAEAMVQKIQLENQVLFFQSKEAEISAKTSELDFEARKRAMEE